MRSSPFVCIVALLSGPAFAGAILTYDVQQYASTGEKSWHCAETDTIEGNKMRQEKVCQNPQSEKRTSVLIYRGDKNLRWDIDSQANVYIETTRAQVDRERKDFEEAVQGVGGHRFQPTGKTRKLRNWTCAVFEHQFHQSTADEYCIVDGDSVFPGAGEAESTKRLLLGRLGQQLSDPEEEDTLADLAMGKGRLTLRQVNTLLDRPVFISELTGGKTAAAPPGAFDLPKGVLKISTNGRMNTL